LPRGQFPHSVQGTFLGIALAQGTYQSEFAAEKRLEGWRKWSARRNKLLFLFEWEP